MSTKIHNYQQMDILNGQKSHGFPSDIKGIARSSARQDALATQSTGNGATALVRQWFPYQERTYSP